MRTLLALGLSALLSRCTGASPTPVNDARVGDAPTVATPRMLTLGDSFTIGTGSPREAAWPSQLVARWGQRGCRVTLENPAVNGYTTDDILREEVPRITGFAPTLVTLAVGANDLVRGSTVERYRTQLRTIFEAVRAAGYAPSGMVVLPQPDWSRSPAAQGFGEPDEIRRSIETFNAALEEETQRVGARWVPMFALMRRQAEAGMIAPDGLHPSAAAHAEWADYLVGALPVPCR